jgi:hypothetical protein
MHVRVVFQIAQDSICHLQLVWPPRYKKVSFFPTVLADFWTGDEDHRVNIIESKWQMFCLYVIAVLLLQLCNNDISDISCESNISCNNSQNGKQN